jgi:hypothetical protein
MTSHPGASLAVVFDEVELHFRPECGVWEATLS